MPLSFRKPESWMSLRFGAITAPPWGQGGACSAPSDGPEATPLACAPHADPPAERPHGAHGAPGRDRRAHVLAKGDEQGVVADPVTRGQLGPERHLGLLRRPRPHVAETVRDPVHVGVDADPRLAVSPRDDHVGSRPPDAFQREEIVDLVGDAPAEALEEIAADPEDHAGLRPIASDGVDEPLDPARRKGAHRFGRVGDREESRRGRARGRVLGAQRQDTGDEDAEGVAAPLGDDGEGGRVPTRRRASEAPDDVPDRYLSEMDSRSFRARGRSFAAQSAATVGAVSSITRWSSRRASAERPVAMYRRARSIRSTVNFGSITRPFLKCASALAGSPPKSRGTSMSTLPASEWARTQRGSSCSRISISSRTVGRRKSERSTPLVWPQRPVLIAYQRWASWFRGASSTARFPSSRPRA